jgi:uncharacterized paraquat-inducible protein A
MLAVGTPECPRCGKTLRSAGDDPHKLRREDIISISVYVWLLALVPLVIILIVSAICIFSGNLLG